ncbi:MAG: hypothetical protein COW59_08425 [Lysobacterales bacterium CG17_big_fil_post_rev_8_21_14_2_50_64_11]|nr:MAG: hypothetical protein COW59_08425 [Xanthomonadales bacterium CG17_big_fil_post_rev_8_21_14_2_50_64_11]PIX60303.1 MAG: hypothetical protein COZ47_07970 [Xanthomonadales bacterium CG_4_10_14_3_um_filter_64_11]
MRTRRLHIHVQRSAGADSGRSAVSELHCSWADIDPARFLRQFAFFAPFADPWLCAYRANVSPSHHRGSPPDCCAAADDGVSCAA